MVYESIVKKPITAPSLVSSLSLSESLETEEIHEYPTVTIAPLPCKALAKTSQQTEVVRAAVINPAIRSTSPIIITFLNPILSASAPNGIWNIACVSPKIPRAYPVSTGVPPSRFNAYDDKNGMIIDMENNLIPRLIERMPVRCRKDLFMIISHENDYSSRLKAKLAGKKEIRTFPFLKIENTFKFNYKLSNIA